MNNVKGTIASLLKRFALQATALSTACLTANAQENQDQPKPGTIVVKDYFGRDRIIFDGDGDGWSDIWCILFPEIKHRNKTTDTDGDGMTDYEEMMMHRDPMVPGPLPEEPTPEQIEEGKRAAAAALVVRQQEWERKLAQAAPRLRPLLRNGERETETQKQQAEDGSAALRREADASRLVQPAKEQALDDIARRHGVQREFTDENGKKLLLTGELMGGPVFIQSHDTLSAAGIGADELWPAVWWWPYAESHTGLSLTGAGQTLGMWEVDGGVRTSHIELGTSRVIQKDSAALDPTSHATNVAGTMAATGAGSLFSNFFESRGVAYQADVFAYNTADFATERADAAAGVGADPPVRLANHSWGSTNGWRSEDIDPTAGVNMQWVWYGPTLASFQEDFKFGFYTPDTQESTGCTQIDHFHHSQATQHLMVYSSGNDRSEGPGVSPGTYYYRTGETSWTPVNAAAFPRDWDDGDAGFYDTLASPGTAKNVLTVGSCEDVFQVSGSNLIIGHGPGATVVPSPFSGAGPTDDGRIKPDLVAVGSPSQTIRQPLGLMAVLQSGQPAQPVITGPAAGANNFYSLGLQGTSFSAPAVTGALGLVLERREQLYPGLPASQAWRGSTLKAIAINTCDDVGAEGPDYRMGYGVMNAPNAVLAVDADDAHGRGSLIKEFSLAPSESVAWVVQSDGTQPLSVTVPWSDPPGPALTSISGPDPQNPMLVNNIDLKVEYLGADTETVPPPSVPVATYLPWVLDADLTTKSATTRGQAAVRDVDDRNNVEKVSIAAPAAGRYRVTVTHSGGLSGNPSPSTQVVSVALGGVTPELPTVTKIEKAPAADEFLVSFTADPGAWFTLESSTDLLTWADEGLVLAESDDNAVVVEYATSEPRRFWRLRRGE